jgi:predicted MFS family arabinose efflux permease
MARQVPTSEWRRHGKVLVPSIAGISLVSVHGYSLGVMMGPLQAEFGWGRAEISAGAMIISFISLLFSPLVGATIDRFGPRPVAITGVIGYTVLLSWFSTTSADIGSWWLRWGMLGLASTIIMPTVWTAAINSLFFVNRGKALAVALLGTGLSATFVPSLASVLIDSFGWRAAYVVMAAVTGGTVLVLVLLFFHGAGEKRAGQADDAPALPLPGLTAREGFRSPAFIKLALGVFVFGVTCLALTVNAVPVLEARGLDRSTAAGIAGLLGIGSIVGRLAGGFLLDRFDAGKVASISVAAPILSMALLLFLPASPVAAGAAMLLLGLALGTEVDACSYLAARHFGMRSFGSLFGTINGIVVFGTGIAPVAANYIYDLAGSYDPVLWATAPLCAFASVLFLTLGGYPDFDEAGRGRVSQPAPDLDAGRMRPAD